MNLKLSRVSGLMAMLLAALAASARAQLPVSGRPVPGMSVFDTIMTNYMNASNITAGVLGISRNGRIEYLRGFGWLRAPNGGDPGEPLPENAMLRTASAVKPITAAAIRQFSAEGGFGVNGLNTNVYNNLVVGTSGLLNVTPSPSLGDSRHANVTLNHLLLHQGGFDRTVDPPGDVMFKSRTVATALGINSPPSNLNTMRYMLGQALQWTPGTVDNINNAPGTDAYSNYGYMVLGEVLEGYAPGGYLGYLRNKILRPDRWIPATEFAMARSLVTDRHPREPRYIASNTGQSVFDNDPPIDVVPVPDGGFYVEAMLAHGGIIASAPAMIHFANSFHVWYTNVAIPTGAIGQPITAAAPMTSYAHSGRLDGCNTWLQQRSDGIVFYLAVNRAFFTTNSDYAQDLGTRVNNQLNAGGFTWPNLEADGFWVALGTENPTAGFGGFNSNYQGFHSALNRVSDGSYLRLRSGSQGWTGTITKQLRLDAPEGPVTLGL